MVAQVEDKVVEIEIKFRLPKNQYFIRKLSSVQELQDYVSSKIMFDDIKHFAEEKKIIQVDNNPFKGRF